MSEPILELRSASVTYRARGRLLAAVSGVDLSVAAGESVGLVGESGCGKSTLGRAMVALEGLSSGQVLFDGTDLSKLSAKALRRMRSRFQMIFQDPGASLNPRRRVGDIVAEGLAIAGIAECERDRRVRISLEAVGLDPETSLSKWPHEFSGGQSQRICIARALVLEPDVLVCDEPVSALDVSVQAKVLGLLKDLRARFGLTMVFVSHDLAVVKNISDRVVVMYMGRICEVSPSGDFFASPNHPYSRALLRSIPGYGGSYRPVVLPGEIPSLIDPPSGCAFRTRCSCAQSRCAEERPSLQSVGGSRAVACHFPLNLAAQQV